MELNEKKRIDKLYNHVQEEVKKKVANYKTIAARQNFQILRINR